MVLAAVVGLGLIAGCSSGSGPKLASADGVLTYKGKPLAGATVMLVPDKGPFAMGVTGADGKFTVSTGGNRGVVVGLVKVSVTEGVAASGDAAKQPKTAAESEEYMKKAAEMQSAMASGAAAVVQAKSTIPARYGKAETSGLSYTIKANGDNHFAIDLVD